MNINPQSLLPAINSFLRKTMEPFYISELIDFLNLKNTPESNESLAEILIGESIAYFIPAEEDINDEIWISRLSFFSDKKISIQITEFELLNKLFIPGSRFLPFSKYTSNPKEIKIIYKGKELKKITSSLSFEKISSYYFLETENTISQILCEDNPKNITIFKQNEESYNYEKNFFITSWDFSDIFKEHNYQVYNSTNPPCFFVKIIDWEFGIFEILDEEFPQISDKDKNEWFDNFEKGINSALKILHINTNTYEIMSFAVFICNELIFTNKILPLELFFENRDTFEIKPYGIEEKFWLKNEKIPMPTNWFDYPINYSNPVELFFFTKNLPITKNALTNLMLTFIEPEYISRFNKDTQNEIINKILQLLLPKKIDDEYFVCKQFLEEIYTELTENYNPFKDSDLKEIRLSLVEFYKTLIKQLISINENKLKTTQVDSQSPIILSQIFLKTLQTFDFISTINQSEYHFLPVISTSIENLTYVYNDAKIDIINNITQINKNKE